MAKTGGLIKQNKKLSTDNYALNCRIKKLESEFRSKKGAVELELLLKDKIEMENERNRSN